MPGIRLPGSLFPGYPYRHPDLLPELRVRGPDVETSMRHDRTSNRPGYIFDNHKKLVEALNSILDAAAVEYDHSEDVVDDFTAYLKEWARQRDGVKW